MKRKIFFTIIILIITILNVILLKNYYNKKINTNKLHVCVDTQGTNVEKICNF